MQTLDEKFEQVLKIKQDSLEKFQSEVKELKRLRKSVQKFPLNWPYNVTAKNADRVAFQARILHSLFDRYEEIKARIRPRSEGLTTHQIWRKINPSSTGTSSATFRGHLKDLKKKRLIEKFGETDDWVVTERALEKRTGGEL